MSTEIAVRQTAPSEIATLEYFSGDQVDLIKRQICKGATDDELQLFLYQCKRTGLDPFSRQIYAIRRKEGGAEKMTIQTGIDGYRIIADRTGRYAPGPETTFEMGGPEGKFVIKATAYVLKRTPDGTWHTVAASAHFDEYAAYKFDGKLTHMWLEKPRIMIAKCAEALALRKAFPAELSGVYTAEEMDRSNVESTELERQLQASIDMQKAKKLMEGQPAAGPKALTVVLTSETSQPSHTNSPSPTTSPSGPADDDTIHPAPDDVECFVYRRKERNGKEGEWVSTGPAPKASNAAIAKVHVLLAKGGYTDEIHRRALNKYYFKGSTAQLSVEECGDYIERLEKKQGKVSEAVRDISGDLAQEPGANG